MTFTGVINKSIVDKTMFFFDKAKKCPDKITLSIHIVLLC